MRKEFANQETRSVLMDPEKVWQTCLGDSAYYNTSGQYAWQTLIAYEACICFCLHAWARGCTEVLEFLHEECWALKSAFGLHRIFVATMGCLTNRIQNNRECRKNSSFGGLRRLLGR